MPPVAASVAVSAVAAGIGVSAGILTVSAALLSVGTSLVLGGLSYALSPKPKKPSFENKGATVAVRQSDLTRQYIYGHTRVTRGYAHMQSTGANGTLHLILMLCEGPLRAINELWVNDYCIPQDWIDADGTITQGRYAGHMTVKKHLGEDTQLADSDAVANMTDWTSDHRLQGIAYLYITMTKNQDVFPTGVPNISAICEGPELYDTREDDYVWSTNIAQYAYDFLRTSRYGFGIEEDDIDATNVSAQMNICDEIVDTEYDDANIASVDTSTDIISLSITDNDTLRLQYGDRVEVVTAGTPPGGLSTATAYYVIPYQVKTQPRIKLATSLANAMAGTAINLTSAGSGTITIRKTGEPRYHGSGIYDAAETLSVTLNDICSGMAGRAINTGGYWTLLAGAWRSPDIELVNEDVRGAGIAWRSDLSMADSYNIVKGLFVSPQNAYQDTDYPAAIYSTFINDDNGIESPKELNLRFIQRPTTAQRIAKIELFRSRQGIVLTCQFSMKGIQAQPGDTVMLTFPQFGWTEKEFEVTEFQFTMDASGLLTKLVLRETAQEIFDWTSGEAILFDPAPNTDLPDPYTVQVVSAFAYSSRSVVTGGGTGTLYMLQGSWDPHPDALVTQYGDFELQYKESGASTWLPSFFVDGSQTNVDMFTAGNGVSYDLRIRARNSLGVRSNWQTITGAIVGSSGGGISASYDYGSVASSLTDPSQDYGNVYDAPTLTADYGFVA